MVADIDDWTCDEKTAFLDRLIELKPTAAALSEIDLQFALSDSANAELRSRWCKLLLQAGVEKGARQCRFFLN